MSESPGPREVVVYDLSSLRFARRGDTLWVRSALGEELACCEVVGLNDRQAVAVALEDASGRSVVWRGEVPHRVAWYHPQTTEVTLGAWPTGVVLGGVGPVPLDAGGTAGRWDGTALVVAGHTLVVAPERPVAALVARRG